MLFGAACEGGDYVWTCKCPTCGGRLDGVEPQRLRTRGAAPRGAQLYVALCPHCGTSVPTRFDGEHDGVQRVSLPRARTSAERSTPRTDPSGAGISKNGRPRPSMRRGAGVGPQPKFEIERAIAQGVSTINDGIAQLDLLPSSMQLIDLQDQIPMIGPIWQFYGQSTRNSTKRSSTCDRSVRLYHNRLPAKPWHRDQERPQNFYWVRNTDQT